MDSCLWDPPICEDDTSDFGGNFAENWWQSDFYCGYGLHDVMEEDALNENACMQVLKRMLSRAKTEIEEVEEEITVLQRQVAWADEIWSKKHSNLRVRINSLDVLMQRLKNEQHQTENALDFHFQTLAKHAEKLSVMLKTLLESYSPTIDVQNFSPKIEKLAPVESKEETKMSNFVAIACDTKSLEETVGPSCTADQTRDVKAKDQNGDATSSDLITNCYTHATDVPLQCDMDTVSITEHMGQETEYQDSTTKADKRLDGTSSDLITNCYRHATDLPIQLDMDNVNSSIHMGQETEYQDSTTKEEKRMYTTEVDKLADMTSDSTADAAKKITKETILKQKLKMQEDASRTNFLNTGKQVDRTVKMTALEPSLAMEMELNISSMKKYNRNMISRIPNVHVGKETYMNFKGDKSNSAAADVNLDSAFKSIGKKKKCLSSPMTKKNVEFKNLQAKMDEDVTSSLIKEEDEDICKDALLKPQKFLPSPTAMVANNSLPLAQLRAMAKERKLKGYSKLKKSDLIKLLG